MTKCSNPRSLHEFESPQPYHLCCTCICFRFDSHFLIKISDFGLTEDIFLRNYFREGLTGEGVKLPVKWMAPESLSEGHLSEKSDVVSINN